MIHDPSFPGDGHPLGSPLEAPGKHDAVGAGPAPAASSAVISAPMRRALEDITRERMRQIVDFGHTPEADRAQPINRLPIEATHNLRGAIDYCQFRRLDLARRYLIKTAAMILAAIERLDAEAEQEDLAL